MGYNDRITANLAQMLSFVSNKCEEMMGKISNLISLKIWDIYVPHVLSFSLISPASFVFVVFYFFRFSIKLF